MDLIIGIITFIIGVITGMYFTKKIEEGINKNIKKK